MLYYLGSGTRNYGDKPVKICRRPYWEFQAVLSGQIAMVEDGGSGRLRSRHLWLSPPGHHHGWTGRRGHPAEVAVFHFLTIPEPLAKLTSEKTSIEATLQPRQINQLRRLATLLNLCVQQPGPEMLLRYEHALLELSLMIYEACGLHLKTRNHIGRQRVQRALDWFAAHLHSNPHLDEVARATGISTAQLRRHFYEVMQSPPKKIFDQIRFQRAIQFMADSGTKLGAVSDACGFESPSAFSRAFKLKFGTSPEKWRGFDPHFP